VRDFVYSEEKIAKEREELEVADATEKELWVTLLAQDISLHMFISSFLST